jgi:hypothetical protein
MLDQVFLMVAAEVELFLTYFMAVFVVLVAAAQYALFGPATLVNSHQLV